MEGLLERRDLDSAVVVKTAAAEQPLTRTGVAVSGNGRVHADAVENYETPESADHLSTFLIRRRWSSSASWGRWTSRTGSLWLNGDGSLLVVGTVFPGYRVELWDTQTGLRRWITPIGNSAVSATALSPNGHTLAVSSIFGHVHTLDLSTGEVLERYVQQISSMITSLVFSPGGEVVAFGGNVGQVHLLEAATLGEMGLLPMPKRPAGSPYRSSPTEHGCPQWMNAVASFRGTPTRGTGSSEPLRSSDATSPPPSGTGTCLASSTSALARPPLWDDDDFGVAKAVLVLRFGTAHQAVLTTRNRSEEFEAMAAQTHH